MSEGARRLAVLAAGVLLIRATLELIGPDGDLVRGFGATGLLLMTCLATIGTLMGRLPQGFNIAATAGFVGIISAIGHLVLARSFVTIAVGLVCLAAAVVLTVVSLVMQRRLKSAPVEPPPHV